MLRFVLRRRRPGRRNQQRMDFRVRRVGGGGSVKSRKFRLRSTLSSLTRRPCEKPNGLTAWTKSDGDARVVRGAHEVLVVQGARSARPSRNSLRCRASPSQISRTPLPRGAPSSATSIASGSPSAPRRSGKQMRFQRRARARGRPRGTWRAPRRSCAEKCGNRIHRSRGLTARSRAASRARRSPRGSPRRAESRRR